VEEAAMNLDLRAAARALGGEIRGGEVLAPGPGHSAADRSLSIKLDGAAPEGFILHSFAGDDPIVCRDYVRGKLGLPDLQPKKSGNGKARSPVTASYIYRDRNGAPYLRVQRTATKQFFQQHWDGANWIKGKPQGPKVPYRLPELLAAAPTTPVYICEGEKDADNLVKLGFLASCNSGGADPGNGSKWTAELNACFKDRHVYILPHNDAPGRQHAQHVARSLYSVAASVRIIDLPGLPPKGDVTDWLKTDPSGARLVEACERAPLFEPAASKRANGGGRKGASEMREAVARGELVVIVEGEKDADNLRKLGFTATCNAGGANKWRAEYTESLCGADVVIIGDNDDSGRAHVAHVASSLKTVACRVRVLDLAKAWPACPAKGDISDWIEAGGTAEALAALIEKQKGAKSETIEPARLLTQIYDFTGRFVAYPSEHAHVAHTLWIVHTHVMDAWESTPRIAFLSPEPESRKTRAPEVTELLVPNPVEAINVTPAYLSPCVEPERDGASWLVLRDNHGWLHSDRRQALRERDEIDHDERFPWGRYR
jgi:5S rRNA maturation endonuclease (ribonuclease M5)